MTLETLVAELTTRAGCTDLHLSVGEPPVWRIGGDLVRGDGPPLSADALETLLAPVLTPDDRLRLESGVPVTAPLDDAPVLVSVFREGGHRLGAALRRMLSPDITLEQIAPVDFERLRALSRLSHGLVVFSGQLGCGKTTTAAALLQEINRSRPVRIFVVEASLSYAWRSERALVTHLVVGRDVDTIPRGIQAALQCDLDVLMLELTPDAIPAALAAADTGHLVLAVMNARSAAHAVEKLHDAAVDPERLARALKAVVCQQLLPRHDRPGRVAAYEIQRDGDARSVAEAKAALAEAGLIAPPNAAVCP